MKWSDGVITSGSSTTTNRMYYAGLPANGFGAGWQLIDERDGAGALVRKYVYGPGIDEPVRMTTSNGTKYYFEQDGLGNVTELASSIGAVIERYTYDVYGKPTMYNAGGSVIPSSAIGNRLLFTGRDRDPDTGLYNFRYRYYSPTLGRFVQPDPISIAGGDWNLYGYVRNNPINSSDASGLSGPELVIIGVVFLLIVKWLYDKEKESEKKIEAAKVKADPADEMGIKSSIAGVEPLLTGLLELGVGGGGPGFVSGELPKTMGEAGKDAVKAIIIDDLTGKVVKGAMPCP